MGDSGQVILVLETTYFKSLFLLPPGRILQARQGKNLWITHGLVRLIDFKAGFTR